jgi:hypothetical protein
VCKILKKLEKKLEIPSRLEKSTRIFSHLLQQVLGHAMSEEDISVFVGNLGTVEGPADIRLFFEKENFVVKGIEMKFGFAFVYIAGISSHARICLCLLII